MRTLMILGLAVVGLQFGCGPGEAEMEAASELTSHEAQLRICTDEAVIAYYTDATYTTRVGTERCRCNRTPTLDGERTDFERLISFRECL